jgi:hypothetical protein
MVGGVCGGPWWSLLAVVVMVMGMVAWLLTIINGKELVRDEEG